MQRRDLIKLAGGSAATLGIPRFAYAQGAYKAEYKMSTVVPPAFAWGKGGEIFLTLVRERTNGRINIKQYPGASLVQGQQDREFAAMRQGIIDVLCGAPINWSGTVPQLGVFTLPFILPDHKAYDAVISSPEVMTDYFELVRKAGAEPLSVGETGYRQISNSKRPLIKPDDLKRHQGARRRQPDVRRDHDRHGRQPDLHELGRRPAGAGLGGGGCAGEPARGLPESEDPDAGPEVRDQVELFERHPAVRHRRPASGQSWTPADQKIVREAAQDAAKQQIALVRTLFNEDVAAVRALGVDVHVPTPAEAEAVAHRLPARLCALEGADQRRAGQQDRGRGREIAQGVRPVRRAAAALPIDSSLFFKLVRVVNLTARPFVETAGAHAPAVAERMARDGRAGQPPRRSGARPDRHAPGWTR